MNNKTVKILTIPAISALAISMSLIGSSAFANDTAVVSPSIPLISPSDNMDVPPSSEGDPSTMVSPEGDMQAGLDGQLSDSPDVPVMIDPTGNALGDLNGEQVDDAEVQAILGDAQVENIGDQNGDLQVDEVNNDNNAENASFNEDITATNQAGGTGDSVDLTESANIVASVTLPEVKAMVSDDAEAHNLLVGTPTK